MSVSLIVMRFLYILLFVGQFASSQDIEGRWFPSGFENTMYEFPLMVYDTLTIVQTKMGVIQSIGVQWIPVMTLPTINPYTIDGNTISMDLFFGTIATYDLGFRCDGQVDFYFDEDDNWVGLHSTMYRQGFDSENNECLNTDSNNCICTEEYNPVCGVEMVTRILTCYATCQYIVIAV